jgi:hypothetical protein
MDEKLKIAEDIRTGKIDINNQELFFSYLIKGLLLELNRDISIRNIPVPHFIVHTGSAALYLENKGQDFSKEPLEVSNENYIYQTIPNCIVSPGGISIDSNQLTNPYSSGQLQYEGDQIYSFTGEFRRLPVKVNVELKYKTDSFRDSLELVQQILTKLLFIRTYSITYMGQAIQCSYRLPEDFNSEYLADISGDTTDSNCKTLSISIEVESSLPVYYSRTIMPSDKYIAGIGYQLNNL